MCSVLKELYKEVFHEDFNYSEKECRILMQKTVYLLENLGVHVGDYSFTWNKYGPYSVGLDGDAYSNSLTLSTQVVKFSDTALSKINFIRRYISENKYSYTIVNWLESIASLHYLKYVLRIGSNDTDVIRELMRRKEYLSDVKANKRAMDIANDVEMIL